ncbi:MAG: PD40 domain-containing protein [Candidatus Promineofilum sp.]|nr:PD40 domain-containing protein [Promineifilum sp.]
MDGLPDVFVYDRQTGQTEMVSVDNYGNNAFGYFYDPSISDDGRYVAFQGWAYYLTTNDTTGAGDIYVHDRQTGLNTRVSVKSNGAHANSDSYNPYLSADGVNVVFESNASNLVTGDTNNTSDVFLHNRNTGVTSRVSVRATNTQVNNYSYSPSISADGQPRRLRLGRDQPGDRRHQRPDRHLRPRRDGQDDDARVRRQRRGAGQRLVGRRHHQRQRPLRGLHLRRR